MDVSLEGSITDVEEFTLLSDVSKFTSYLTSKLGGKVRGTLILQGTEKLIVLEKIV